MHYSYKYLTLAVTYRSEGQRNVLIKVSSFALAVRKKFQEGTTNASGRCGSKYQLSSLKAGDLRNQLEACFLICKMELVVILTCYGLTSWRWLGAEEPLTWGLILVNMGD